MMVSKALLAVTLFYREDEMVTNTELVSEVLMLGISYSNDD